MLRAENISRQYHLGKMVINALNNVSIHINPGETVGVAGESGSGKSTLARILLGLEKADSGTIWFWGENISTLRGKALLAFRKSVGVVFQQPGLSFDPRWPLWRSLEEPLWVLKRLTQKERVRRVREIAEQTAISQDLLSSYPHQLSGGQLQRAAIARAIALKPQLVILDEPTSALDVSVQAQILNLLNDLKQSANIAYLFVSHDMAVLAHMADRLFILKKGWLIESGETETVLQHPQEEYTKNLISAVLG